MIFLLVFLSGFAALVYQVLWLRDLGLIFGNTAEAAALDVAVFFLGLAIGAAAIGRVAGRLRRPLRAYGVIELGIAASALLFLGLQDAYQWTYQALQGGAGDATVLAIAIKISVALLMLGPATCLMGCTLPLIAQHVVRRADALGRQGALLYGINTAGATAGAFCAGFFLPALLGFQRSYLLAIAVNTVVGVIALVIDSRAEVSADLPPRTHAKSKSRPARVPTIMPRERSVQVLLLAFLSGVLTLALELAWVRMFAQVLDNSIYTFSAVLVIFLVALACGSFVSSRLAARSTAPAIVLPLLLLMAGLLVAMQPALFIALTDGMSQLTAAGEWAAYVGAVFRVTGAVLFVPGVLVGTIFPYLLRAITRTDAPGAIVARLTYVNVGGAIVGSLAVTFVAMPAVGLWRTVEIIAAAYVVLSLAIARGSSMRLAAVAALALITLAGGWGSLPLVHLDARRAERVLQTWEGAHGIVAVTERSDGRLLRMNNSYRLGGTVDRIERERIQSFIPLLLHPQPDNVFYLGMGSGITAGEAIRHPVRRVVVCELVPEVVEASERYFSGWTRGLEADPRIDIRTEDGRHWLSTTDQRFDVIVSDLFVPWHAGTASLYTREHFEVVRSRLREGGLFAQWLPLFQLGETDFAIIARTLLDVFPHVTIWRGDFYASRSIVALVASTAPLRLQPDLLSARVQRVVPGIDPATVLPMLLPYYAANLGDARDLLGPGDINTDDRPVIEYGSPARQWQRGPNDSPWFVARRLVGFIDRLHATLPLDRDPFLTALSEEQRRYVEAGTFYYKAVVDQVLGDEDAAQRALGEALRRLPERIHVAGPFMALEPLLR